MDEKGDVGIDDEQEEQTEGENTKNTEELDAVSETDGKPAPRVSLREKLNAMKEQAAGTEKQSFQKDRVREETL